MARRGRAAEACLTFFLGVLIALIGLLEPRLLTVQPLVKQRFRLQAPLLTQLCVNDGTRLGVRGTPTFFVNGTKSTYEGLKTAIDAELAK